MPSFASFIKYDKQLRDYRYRSNWRLLRDQINTSRDAAWPGDAAPSNDLPESIRQLILSIKACMDQQREFPEIAMEIVDDLFLTATKNIKQVD